MRVLGVQKDSDRSGLGEVSLVEETVEEVYTYSVYRIHTVRQLLIFIKQ